MREEERTLHILLLRAIITLVGEGPRFSWARERMIPVKVEVRSKSGKKGILQQQSSSHNDESTRSVVLFVEESSKVGEIAR